METYFANYSFTTRLDAASLLAASTAQLRLAYRSRPAELAAGKAAVDDTGVLAGMYCPVEVWELSPLTWRALGVDGLDDG